MVNDKTALASRGQRGRSPGETDVVREGEDQDEGGVIRKGGSHVRGGREHGGITPKSERMWSGREEPKSKGRGQGGVT